MIYTKDYLLVAIVYWHCLISFRCNAFFHLVYLFIYKYLFSSKTN